MKRVVCYCLVFIVSDGSRTIYQIPELNPFRVMECSVQVQLCKASCKFHILVDKGRYMPMLRGVSLDDRIIVMFSSMECQGKKLDRNSIFLCSLLVS